MSVRIGEAAAAAGVSTRTLRYYEQRGLLAPSEHSHGGERRYDVDAVERLRRIRELAQLLGADLEEIRSVLTAEDRLADIKVAYRSPGQSQRRQRELLEEALAVRRNLLERVTERIDGLQALRIDLRARIAHVEDLQASLPSTVNAP